MSFTIAQRTREIGIRSALGAQSRQLLLGIFGRAMRQLSIGLAVGSLISTSAFSAAGAAKPPLADRRRVARRRLVVRRTIPGRPRRGCNWP